MPIAAVGKRGLLAFLPSIPLIDDDGDYRQLVGIPAFRHKPLAAPSTPTASAGSSGLPNESRTYFVAYHTKDCEETLPSAASNTVALANEKGRVPIPVAGDARVDWRIIYSSNTGELEDAGWVGTIYNNTASASSAVLSAPGNLSDATFSGTSDVPWDLLVIQLKISTAGTPDKFEWRVSVDGGVTFGSWSGEVSITGSSQSIVHGISVTFGATTGHTLDDVFQRIVAQTEFLDNTANDKVDYTRHPRSASSVGAVWGFRGLWFDSLDFHEEYKTERPAEIRGNVGPSELTPAEVVFDGTIVTDARAGTVGMFSQALMGKGTVTRIPNTPITVVEVVPDTAIDDPRTIDALTFEGAKALGCQLFFGGLLAQQELKFEAFKAIVQTIKLMAINHTLYAVGTKTSGSGSYWDTWGMVVRGIANAIANGLTIYWKCTTAPVSVDATTGKIGFKFSLTDISTFGGSDTEVFLYYDLATHQVIASPDTYDPYFEMVDENGLAIGLDDDENENRQPAQFTLPGDVTTIAINDAGSIEPKFTKPTVLRQEGEPRLMMTHLSLRQGAVSPTALKQFLTGSLKLTQKVVASNPAGYLNKTANELDATDVIEWMLTLDRRYIDREYQRLVQLNSRFALKLGAIGSPMLIQPGVLSTVANLGTEYRRGFVDYVPCVQLVGTGKRQIGNRGVLHEALEFLATQSRDETLPLLRRTITTTRYWDMN